jgi:hypothetical protein
MGTGTLSAPGLCLGVDEIISPTHTHKHPAPEVQESLSAVLLHLGVYVLTTARREAIAKDLANAGVTPADVQQVAAFIASSESDVAAARKYLCGYLSRPQALLDAINNLRKFQAGKPKAGMTHQRGIPVPYWTCECAECADARNRGIPNKGPRPSFLLDGTPPPKTESLYLPEPAPRRSRVDDSAEEQERRKLFVEQMRGKRTKLEVVK